MKLALDLEEQTGLYLGTEINEKWWRRYTKNKFLARGNGRYWYDNEGFNFLRYLTKTPLRIPLAKIKGFKIGKWHSGRWANGCPILKIIWVQDGQTLSSGFLVAQQVNDINSVISKVKAAS